MIADPIDELPLLRTIRDGIGRLGAAAYAARSAGDDEDADRLEGAVESMRGALALVEPDEDVSDLVELVLAAALRRQEHYDEPRWLRPWMTAHPGEPIGVRDPHRLQVDGLTAVERRERGQWHRDRIQVETASLTALLAGRELTGLPIDQAERELLVLDLGMNHRGRLSHHGSILAALAWSRDHT